MMLRPAACEGNGVVEDARTRRITRQRVSPELLTVAGARPFPKSGPAK
jgi:hypothetical protein